MSEVFDEDTGEFRKRTLSNFQVLKFISSYWLRQPARLAGAVTTTLVAIGFESTMPRAAEALVDATRHVPASAPIAWQAWLFFVGVYVTYSVVRITGLRFFWNTLAANNMEQMTNEAFKRVQSYSSDWHGDTFAGATVRRISRAMWGYDVVSDAVVMWIGPALIVLTVLSVKMMLRWPLIGAYSLVMVALYIAANILFSNYYVMKANRKSVALDSRIGGALADAISSNPTVKSFGAEAREESRFAEVTLAWRKATQATWNRYIEVWLVQNLLLAMLQGGLTGLLILRWLDHKADPGDVAFVITTFLIMSGYLRNMGDNIRMMQRGLADVEDVASYARLAPQVLDHADARPFIGQAGEIVFDHVSFRYKSADTDIYDDFCLRITPGERLALVGPTGSGKSTFVKLVQRLYDVQAGRILIDGQDIAHVTQGTLRRSIAAVPQDPALFHRTVAENIGYARPDATMDEIILAAKRARAHDFISKLPKGYETLVGERGVKLSGGERQRVAIARAFLADAPILVLDEATSSLDVETEREVQTATEALMRGRTTIVIAHRLSTIRHADRILVFQNGRIVEEGAHADLVHKGGVYARLNAVAEGAV
jgi:ATP-binding cassette subfamily B protein